VVGSRPSSISTGVTSANDGIGAVTDVRAEGQAVVSPVCVVSKAHFLTGAGWTATDETGEPEQEPPFALFRDAGRTYLQVKTSPAMISCHLNSVTHKCDTN